MGSIRKTMASMLAVLALTAFMSDASAQTRRSSDVNRSNPTRQSTNRSSSQTRSSSSSSQTRRTTSSAQTRKSNDNNKSTAVRPSSQTRPSRQTAVRPSQTNDRKPSTTVTRPSAPAGRPDNKPSTSKPAPGQPSGNKNDFKPGNQNQPVQITRPAPNRPQGNNQGNRPGIRPDDGPGNKPGKPGGKPNDRPGNGPGMKPGNGPGNGPGHGPGKPVQIRPDHRHQPPRVHPRERDFMRWDRPSYWWSHNNHYYGYRVRVLPTHVIRHVYHGVTYYCYNDIWYRPYGGYYVVCRPPYGLSLAANIISDIAWTAVRLSYYNTVANAYSQINDNNAYIAEQNAVIAQNNATIAAQNATIAQNQQLAQSAYTLANNLGLIQSYAAASSEYFYQDGVFYAKDASGEYKVILPPAGALIETLPEDFDIVTLSDGNEYYKVDDTIYKVTVSDGKPYFEVVGQQYN